MKATATKSKTSAAPKTVPQALQEVLKHTYVTFLLTHNYHWNVEGPSFSGLHTMFETQYNELFLAVDVIAERARSLDVYALPDVAEYAAIADTMRQEATAFKGFGKDGAATASQMLANLVQVNAYAIEAAEKLKKLAEDSEDDETADLAVERITAHQKATWMLKSHLK